MHEFTHQCKQVRERLNGSVNERGRVQSFRLCIPHTIRSFLIIHELPSKRGHFTDCEALVVIETAFSRDTRNRYRVLMTSLKDAGALNPSCPESDRSINSELAGSSLASMRVNHEGRGRRG